MDSNVEKQRSGWTRRDVLRTVAGAAALAPFHSASALIDSLQPSGFAYVACSGNRRSSIETFAVREGKWTNTQSVLSHAPAALILSHSQRTLYVANNVDEFEGLPCGSVEAFSIHPGDGSLTLLGRQALSMSATRPRSMALSPEGKLLAIAAYGGGVYNLLPIGVDGSLGRPLHTFKQTGSGPEAHLQASAHPHTVLFDERSRQLLSSDFGSDRISVFSIQNDRLRRTSHESTGAGSGPATCLLHHETSTLFAWHDFDNTLISYRYRTGDGRLSAMQRLFMNSAEKAAAHGSLALHTSGKVLYSANATNGKLTAWAVDPDQGTLSHRKALSLGGVIPTQLVANQDGEGIVIVAENAIYNVKTDAGTGEPVSMERLANLDDAKSVALKTL